MQILTCAVDLLPCPAEQQAVFNVMSVADLASLGLTPEAILAAYVFGAASVVVWWFGGFVIASATRAVGKA